MIPSNGHGLLGLMADAAKANPAPRKDQALGYVTTATGPYVTFDEDVTETASALTVVGSYQPALGDRVLMQRINGKWVIIGPIGPGATASDTWHAPTMSAGWANYSPATYEPAGYRLDRSGRVKFKGLIIPPAAGTAANTVLLAAGTLPVGYRPALHQDFPLGCSTGVSYTARVLSTGAVLAPSNIALPASIAWLSLAAIDYLPSST